MRKCHLFSGFSIEGPSQAKIECDDKGDGSCDVRYWPTEPGDYAVHVVCDDQDIKDSPFIAHILPAANDVFPEKVISTHWIINQIWECKQVMLSMFKYFLMLQVKAYGPGLQPTGVTVNKPTEFIIDAHMAGKGQLKIYAQVKRVGASFLQFIFVRKNLKEVVFFCCFFLSGCLWELWN